MRETDTEPNNVKLTILIFRNPNAESDGLSDFKLNLIQRSDNKSDEVRSRHARQRGQQGMQAAERVSRG